MKRFVLNIILAGFAIASVAQKVELKASLDSTTVLIGDQVYVRVQVAHPAGLKVNFPSYKDSLMNKVEVIETKIDTLSKTDALIVERQNILISSFDSGVYNLPPLLVPFTFNGRNDTIRSNSLQLVVYSVPVDTAKPLYDIKPIMKVPISFREMLPWILGGLGLAGIIILLVWLLGKYKRKEPVFAERKVLEPAHVIAFRELEQLKDKKLWQQGKVKEYHSALTDIVRMYIERRMEVPAMESTSMEIYDGLKRLKMLDDAVLSELNVLLTTADLVKFAKASPLPDENEDSYTKAYEFIRKTKQEVVIEPVSADQTDQNNTAL